MGIEFFTGFEGCSTWEQAASFFNSSYKNTYAFYEFQNEGFNNSKAIGIDGYVLHWGGFGSYTKNCIPSLTKVVGFHRKGFTRYNVNATNNTILLYASLVYFGGADIRIIYDGVSWAVKKGTTLIFLAQSNLGVVAPVTTLFHAEVKCVVDSIAGSVEVKINGEYAFQAFNINTGTTAISNIRFVYGWFDEPERLTAATYSFYDNIFISDNWEGILYSALLKPASDNFVQFTPFSGLNNFAAVLNLDSNYVYTNVINYKDLYNWESLDINLTINAISIVINSKVDVEIEDDKVLQVIAKQDLIEYNVGEFIILKNIYANSSNNPLQTRVISTAPNSTPWTIGKFNTIQWGFILEY